MALYISPDRPLRVVQPELGRGAEGHVFALRDTNDLCLKVYDEVAHDLDQRLDVMLRSVPRHWKGDHAEHCHLTWPQAKVFDEDGKTVGFLMPRLGSSQNAKLELLFDPGRRLQLLEEPTWGQLVAIAGRIARLVAMLHDQQIVVGDLSGSNIWVARSGHVTFIDCDSMQLRDPASGAVFPARKNTPGYAPPELLRLAVPEMHPEHDRFALAILVCQLLMEGDHPFEGVPREVDVDATLDDNVAMQRNRITHPERFRPRAADIPVELLPPGVWELARLCFGYGHDDASARPTAQQWSDTLGLARVDLRGCRVGSHHVYSAALPGCLWCERKAAGNGDNFPSTATSEPAAPWVGPQPAPAGANRPAPARTPRPPRQSQPTSPPPSAGGPAKYNDAAIALVVVVALVVALILLALLI